MTALRAVSSPTYVTTKTDGTTVNASNVGDALTNLNNEVVKPITFAGNSGSVDRKLGETLNITGGLTASGSNSNVKTVISGNTVDIQLADALYLQGSDSKTDWMPMVRKLPMLVRAQQPPIQ
ncbi:hypothetical protein IDM30_05310 [Acinetobacter seifertii]|nr:hypothetical protein [Acinetobacter seifertii]